MTARWPGAMRGLAAMAVACALATPPAAQAVKQERRLVARHQQLLRELWLEARRAEPERVAAADRALLGDVVGDPLGPLTAAIAALRGVEADHAFRLRAGIQATALPEVVDPEHVVDGDPSRPFELFVTVYTPHLFAGDPQLSFALSLRDAAGVDVASATIRERTSAEDLVRLQARASLPAVDLADGRYTLRVDTVVAGEPPRDRDVSLRREAFVLRGFVARARAVLEAASDGVAADPVTAAMLRGLCWPVQRVYHGEPRDGDFDPIEDLAFAEEALRRLRAGDAMRLSGWRSLAVAAAGDAGDDGDRDALLRVRMPAWSEERARPLVLFLPGTPTWDGRWARPSFVPGVPPGHLAAALRAGGFDAGERFVVAVMESTGTMAHPVRALRAAIEMLAAHAGADPARVVLVGEREGAAVAARAALRGELPAPVRGLVLACGGALSRDEAAALGAMPVLLVAGAGHPSQANLDRTVAFAAEVEGSSVRNAPGPAPAWPWALLRQLDAVASFCVEVSGG